MPRPKLSDKKPVNLCQKHITIIKRSSILVNKIKCIKCKAFKITNRKAYLKRRETVLNNQNPIKQREQAKRYYDKNKQAVLKRRLKQNKFKIGKYTYTQITVRAAKIIALENNVNKITLQSKGKTNVYKYNGKHWSIAND